MPVVVIERVPVVNDVVVVGSRRVQYGVVAGSGAHLGVLLQYLSDALKGAEGRVGDSVCHAVIRACPSALAPHEVALAVPAEHHRTFDVLLGRDFLVDRPVLERKETRKVGLQPHHIAVSPASVVHIIIIPFAEDELVDRLRPVHNLVDEWFAQKVAVRPLRTVADGDTDAPDFPLVYIVGGKEEIVLPVLLDDGRCPHGTFRPADLRRVQYGLVPRPVHQVFRGEAVEAHLLIKLVAQCGVYPIRIAVDSRLGVGIPAVEYRVAAAHRGALFARCLLFRLAAGSQ